MEGDLNEASCCTHARPSRTMGVCDLAISVTRLNSRTLCVRGDFLGLRYTELLRVISGVLNDLCSTCNWVASPEIRVGFNTEREPRSRKGEVGRAVQSGHDSSGTGRGVVESKAALSALCKGQADVKKLLNCQFYPTEHLWTNKYQLHSTMYYT